MKIAFVIPTYNRARNLDLVLHALTLQTDPFFSVVVSDDGSDDNTRGVVASYIEKLAIFYTTQEHKGYRVSRVRNNGVKAARLAVTHYWFIDSDVVLNPHAVENIRPVLEAHPDVVVCGRYDWMPPMHITKEDLEERWNLFVRADLPPLPAQDDQYTGGREIVGHKRHFDVRQHANWSNSTPGLCTGATLSGNLLVPKDAFVKVGGFDEKIEGQGQDCDFGKMLGREGVQMLFSDLVIGYHLYHYRDLEFCATSVKETIAYMAEKFS